MAGWLLLRGKCRRCRAPIPKSYLRVEVGFGLLFLAVMYLIAHTGGSTFPLRSQESYFGALWTIWYPRPELLRIWGYFTLLAAALAVFRLFVVRGERLPGHYVLAALLAGVLLPVWTGGLQQVPLAGVRGGEAAGHTWATAGWVEAVLGTCVGVLVGFVLSLARPPRAASPECRPWLPLSPRLDLPVLLAVAGTWLGWQAVVSVGVLAAVGGLLFRRSSPATVTLGAVAVHFALWRVLTEFVPWWPGPRTPWPLFAVWAAVIAGGVFLGRRLMPAIATSESPPSDTSPQQELPPPEPAVPTADSAAGN